MSFMYKGQVAPHIYSLQIGPGVDNVDLSTVTVVSFKAKDPTGAVHSWSATITAQTATSLQAKYSFASSPSPIPISGTWKVYALLTVPAGIIRTTTADLEVLPEYG